MDLSTTVPVKTIYLDQEDHLEVIPELINEFKSTLNTSGGLLFQYCLLADLLCIQGDYSQSAYYYLRALHSELNQNYTSRKVLRWYASTLGSFKPMAVWEDIGEITIYIKDKLRDLNNRQINDTIDILYL